MKKISTKELAKKTYEKVTKEVGVKNKDLALTLTFKYLRYSGVDCELLELSETTMAYPILVTTGFPILIIKFANEEEVMNAGSEFVPNVYNDWFALDASRINLNTVRPAQRFFAKVNTGMFKV